MRQSLSSIQARITLKLTNMGKHFSIRQSGQETSESGRNGKKGMQGSLQIIQVMKGCKTGILNRRHTEKL